MAAPRVLTTGRLAKLLGVCPRTVANWIDRGELEAYRLSPHHDRRVEIEVALAFVRSKPKWPIKALEEYARKCGVPLDLAPAVLICSPTVALTNPFHAEGLDPDWAGDAFDAGAKARERRYEIVVIDQALGTEQAELVIERFARKYSQTRRVLVACEDDRRGEKGWRCDDYCRHPVDFAALARELFGRLRAGVPQRKAG